VYIGPDISKKDEAMQYDDDRKVDLAITFTELRSLFKYYNIDGTYVNSWDYTRVGSMSAAYLTSVSSSSNPATGILVAANQLDGFVSSIASSMTAIRNTVSLFSEFYCHSSCHSSCHGSRGRR